MPSASFSIPVRPWKTESATVWCWMLRRKVCWSQESQQSLNWHPATLELVWRWLVPFMAIAALLSCRRRSQTRKWTLGRQRSWNHQDKNGSKVQWTRLVGRSGSTSTKRDSELSHFKPVHKLWQSVTEPEVRFCNQTIWWLCLWKDVWLLKKVSCVVVPVELLWPQLFKLPRIFVRIKFVSFSVLTTFAITWQSSSLTVGWKRGTSKNQSTSTATHGGVKRSLNWSIK